MASAVNRTGGDGQQDSFASAIDGGTHRYQQRGAPTESPSGP